MGRLYHRRRLDEFGRTAHQDLGSAFRWINSACQEAMAEPDMNESFRQTSSQDCYSVQVADDQATGFDLKMKGGST
jgi:hypothetical protein